jgi:hypothetical protein
MILKHEVNALNREKYIKVNGALEKAAIFWGNKYPEPTLDNVLHPNSKRLVVIWKKYLLYERNWRLAKILSAVFRIAINKIEHSPNWRDRASWFVEELIDCGWKPRSLNHPEHDWNEPKPYGGR